MSVRRPRAEEALAAFVATPLDDVLARAERDDGRAAALALFHDAARDVPAYAAFLARHGVDAASVSRFEELARVPRMTKPDYVARYPLADRCWGGRLARADRIAVSSGSTGEPTFWPRSLVDELPVARRFEQVLVDAFRADERTTLAVVAFPMGTWVGGVFTTSCLRHVALRGRPITTVAPGNVKDEILRVAFALGPAFEQVVLLGYPPFLKDVVDTGRARGLDFAPLRPKLVLAGEVVSEAWRTLVCERIGADPRFDVASLYGTADGGVLGCETPLSVALRRFYADRPDAARELFGEPRLPTLVQYDPTSRFFEVEDGTLSFTGDGGAPLVRYHIADEGGLFGFDELVARAAALGFDAGELVRAGAKVRRLPFVYVFGRSHFTVSFYGANVYPENVAVGLEQPGVREHVTGKFVIVAHETEAKDKELRLVVELAPGAASSAALGAQVAALVRDQLVRLNSEFAHYVPQHKQTPHVDLRPPGDPEYFPTGVKHRYTRPGSPSG